MSWDRKIAITFVSSVLLTLIALAPDIALELCAGAMIMSGIVCILIFMVGLVTLAFGDEDVKLRVLSIVLFIGLLCVFLASHSTSAIEERIQTGTSDEK